MDGGMAMREAPPPPQTTASLQYPCRAVGTIYWNICDLRAPIIERPGMEVWTNSANELLRYRSF